MSHKQPQRRSTPNTSPTSTYTNTTSLRQLTWDNSNHISVLTQLNGSVWPKVWPYCVVNVLLASGVFLLHHHCGWDGIKTSSTGGHKYLAMIMSFLVVTRVKILYDRYMHDSAALQECLRCTRELVVLSCHLTATDTKAQAYRLAVATQALRLLSVTMQVLQLRTAVRAEQYAKERKITSVPETLRVFPQSRRGNDLRCSSTAALFQLSPRMILTEACRAPVHCAYEVRSTILSHRAGSKEGHVLAEGTLLHPCNEEMRLLDAVATFLKSFATLEQNMSTPIPFPLVQMAKTILFVWLYTLPFALPMAKHDMLLSMVLVFLITYGFLGLECVAMELADCFGDDASDLDNEGAAEQCAEDCYLALYKCDGRLWALQLREAMQMEQDKRFRRPSVPRVLQMS